MKVKQNVVMIKETIAPNALEYERVNNYKLTERDLQLLEEGLTIAIKALSTAAENLAPSIHICNVIWEYKATLSNLKDNFHKVRFALRHTGKKKIEVKVKTITKEE
jgi:hypothetical protein